jgi:REP element-mobilizing transposase RayT
MFSPIKGRPSRLEQVFQVYDSPVYFVTFCALHRQPILANERVHAAFRAYSERGLQEHHVAVGRYVIMPDHVHLFVCGGQTFDLGLWVRGLKRSLASAVAAGTAAATTPAGTAKIWQPGIFDHLMRSSESYAEKWEYVRRNPVRALLVTLVEDWPFQGEIVPLDHF